MSKETAPKRETANTKLRKQVEQTYNVLFDHAISNIGMPYDTPLRWKLGRFQGEDVPRYHELWILIPNGATMYLTKTLNAAGEQAGPWQVTATESIEKEGVDYATTTARILDSGKVEKSYTEYKDNERGDPTCIGIEADLSRRERARLVPHLTELLEQAAEIMPEAQREFMENLGQHELQLASLMQALAASSFKDLLKINAA